MFKIKIEREGRIITVDPDELISGDLFRINHYDSILQCTGDAKCDENDECVVIVPTSDGIFHVSIAEFDDIEV